MLTVKDVEYEGGYTLLCKFSDGVRKRIDLTPLLQYPAFEELRDEREFMPTSAAGRHCFGELIIHRRIHRYHRWHRRHQPADACVKLSY